MEYFGIVPGQSSRLSKITKWGVALVAVYMGVRGVQAGLWYYIPFALILIIFSFYRKEQAISAKGLDDRRVFIVYKTHSIWPWKDVTRILADYETMKPLAMLLVASGDKKRQYMLKEEDAKAVLKLAEKQNPQIIIETQDASGRHRNYQYNGSTRNERKAAERGEIQQPESFESVKEELKKQKERAEQLASYRRPDPASANVTRPAAKLKGFR